MRRWATSDTAEGGLRQAHVLRTVQLAHGVIVDFVDLAITALSQRNVEVLCNRGHQAAPDKGQWGRGGFPATESVTCCDSHELLKMSRYGDGDHVKKIACPVARIFVRTRPVVL